MSVVVVAVALTANFSVVVPVVFVPVVAFAVKMDVVAAVFLLVCL